MRAKPCCGSQCYIALTGLIRANTASAARGLKLSVAHWQGHTFTAVTWLSVRSVAIRVLSRLMVKALGLNGIQSGRTNNENTNCRSKDS
ncbi:hypothetical protein BQ9544_2764 [Escherichia coli O127:H6]|uniref:Uncharacterized protein n=1 Tax=Escherichia coli O127:H6 (strain E2348/69 / EPEC) TaxID=574521 RepID=B7UGS7_ECO27|nr:predicted protein [Escherichia coli O127:H6 str. E2348/69]SLM07707.1 hypothetical protein BQ9544_2764 [Escherichia coli O127:H6]SNU20478.1 hypothetical protein BQ9550_2764 [Escherichia coli O127:H6]